MFYQLKNILFSNFIKTKHSLFSVGETFRKIHLSQAWYKSEERRTARTKIRKDEGTEGESNLAIDSINLT